MMQINSELKQSFKRWKILRVQQALRGNTTLKKTHHRSLDHRRKGAKLTASGTTALASNEDQAEHGTG